jgi:histidine triad (HIT) family protein
MNDRCPFCRIIRRQLPGYILWEDPYVIVFLSKGNHPLVVTKEHVPNIYALDAAQAAAIMQTTVRIARAVKMGLQCEGVYLTQANEPAAGQDVFHFHLHVYPRWADVEFATQQAGPPASDDERQATLERLLAALDPS